MIFGRHVPHAPLCLSFLQLATGHRGRRHVRPPPSVRGAFPHTAARLHATAAQEAAHAFSGRVGGTSASPAASGAVVLSSNAIRGATHGRAAPIGAGHSPRQPANRGLHFDQWGRRPLPDAGGQAEQLPRRTDGELRRLWRPPPIVHHQHLLPRLARPLRRRRRRASRWSPLAAAHARGLRGTHLLSAGPPDALARLLPLGGQHNVVGQQEGIHALCVQLGFGLLQARFLHVLCLRREPPQQLPVL